VAYASPNDMIARYPNRDLVQLTNEDPTQTTVNTTLLQQMLDDASVEIDSYLESRFKLPLTDPPAVLNLLACDIAMYRLQALRPEHDLSDARRRYDDALGLLLRAAKGEVALGLSADNLEPPQAQNAVLTQAGGDPSGALPPRVFDRGSLKGF
jgi:phage gp36-like protein